MGSFVSRSEPMATRISRCTGWPRRLNISRTSCVFPSPTTTFHHELTPVAVTRASATSCGTTFWPSITVPAASLPRSPSSGTPRTLTRYSRMTPKRGCDTFIARSPSLVSSTRPSEA